MLHERLKGLLSSVHLCTTSEEVLTEIQALTSFVKERVSVVPWSQIKRLRHTCEGDADLSSDSVKDALDFLEQAWKDVTRELSSSLNKAQTFRNLARDSLSESEASLGKVTSELHAAEARVLLLTAQRDEVIVG